MGEINKSQVESKQILNEGANASLQLTDKGYEFNTNGKPIVESFLHFSHNQDMENNNNVTDILDTGVHEETECTHNGDTGVHEKAEYVYNVDEVLHLPGKNSRMTKRDRIKLFRSSRYLSKSHASLSQERIFTYKKPNSRANLKPCFSVDSLSSVTEEVVASQNSNIKSYRKPIDITKSTLYKEIYARNLRLYSTVLAKQFATSSQVGKEMDHIRRTKNRERALNKKKDEKRLPRSQSFTNGSRPRDEEGDRYPFKRAYSEGAQAFRNALKKSRIDEDLVSSKKRQIDEELADENDQCVGNKKTTDNQTSDSHDKNRSNATILNRREGAKSRDQNLRHLLDSFDKIMENSALFLKKHKPREL